MMVSKRKSKVYYRKGFKYQIAKDFSVQTAIFGHEAHTEYIHLYPDGMLIVKEGYASDGPSGPTIDTKTFMRGSFVHDALCELMRQGYLPRSLIHRVNDELITICEIDGMCKLRRWWVEKGVDDFGDFAGDPKNKRKILEAP